MTSPTPISSVATTGRRLRKPRSVAPTQQDSPWDQEYGRDVWQLRELGIRDRSIANIHFTDIPQPWLKELAKRWARWRLSIGRVPETAALGVLAISRFGKFLAGPAMNVGELAQVDRPVLERYLAHLHAELAGRVQHRQMIGQLNLFFTAVRQHGWDPTLATSAMFFPEDIPKEGQWLPRALSEHVMAQLERSSNLDKWNDPDFQLVTLVLMRCGLRVNDALRLHRDCILRDADGAPYLRYFNHKMKREALVPIDDELERLIAEHRAQLEDRIPRSLLLFPTGHDSDDGNRPRHSSTYRKALRRWVKRIDVRDEQGQPVHLTPRPRTSGGTPSAPG